MVPSLALYACDVCTRRKRKCDRSLQGCALCLSKKLDCIYSKDAESHSTARSRTLSSSSDVIHTKCTTGAPPVNRTISRTSPPWSAGHQNSLYKLPTTTATGINEETPTNSYPTVQFLDYYIFRKLQMEIPPPCSTSDPQPPCLQDVTVPTVLRNIAELYFDTVHKWLPIVSMNRFYENLVNPLMAPRADVSLLVLCMKLVTSYPTGPKPQSDVYVNSKKMYLDFEMRGLVTLQVLQAGILIAVFEMGHAIYPSAYLSVGACARLAYMLGLKARSRFYQKPASWVEVEEKSRVWWGICVLDRLVNLGCPGRPFAMESPDMEDVLPSDDFLWDQGVQLSNDSPTLSSTFDINTGRFALLIHASHLLGRVLNHISDSTPSDLHVAQETEHQLDVTLTALIHLCETKSKCIDTRCIKDLGNAAPLAVCYSTLVIFTNHTPQTPRARHLLTTATTRIAGLCQNFLQGSAVSPSLIHAVPIYNIYAAYLAATQHIGVENAESMDFVSVVKATLEGIGRGRWRAAGKYIQLLEAREMMLIDARRFGGGAGVGGAWGEVVVGK